jgi:hypothetical protein
VFGSAKLFGPYDSPSITDSVTSIGESSFGGCTNLTTINYMGTQEQWDAINKSVDWNSACPNVEIVYEYTLAR